MEQMTLEEWVVQKLMQELPGELINKVCLANQEPSLKRMKDVIDQTEMVERDQEGKKTKAALGLVNRTEAEIGRGRGRGRGTGSRGRGGGASRNSRPKSPGWIDYASLGCLRCGEEHRVAACPKALDDVFCDYCK